MCVCVCLCVSYGDVFSGNWQYDILFFMLVVIGEGEESGCYREFKILRSIWEFVFFWSFRIIFGGI